MCFFFEGGQVLELFEAGTAPGSPEVQEYGLYQPRYNFKKNEGYKDVLTTIRNQQKQMIKQDIAASGNTDWTVNNNKAKGRKMVNDMKKLG